MRPMIAVLIPTFVCALACGGGGGDGTLTELERTSLTSIPSSRIDMWQMDEDLDQVLTLRSTNLGWEAGVNGASLSDPYSRVGQDLGFSPGGRPWFTWADDAGWYAQVGDESFGPYVGGIGTAGVVFSDTGHHAFQAKTDTGWTMVLDGKAGDEVDDLSQPLLEGDHHAWLTLKAGTLRIHHDGAIIGRHKGETLLLGLSPDGAHIGWVAKDDAGWQLYVDEDNTGRHHQHIGGVAYAPDGSFAYVAQNDDGWHLYWQDTDFGPFDDVSLPVFREDGELAYGAKSDGKWTLRVGDWVSPGQDMLGEGSPAFHGDTFAWWSENEGKQYVWKGETQLATVQTVSDLGVWFTDNGDAAWVFHDGTGWRAARGDWRSPAFQDIAKFETSDTHVGLVANDDKGWGVFVGRPEADAPLVPYHGAVGSDQGGGIRFEGDQVVFTDVSGAIERVAAALP